MATWGAAVVESCTEVIEDPRMEEEMARVSKNPERGVTSLAEDNTDAKQPVLTNSATDRGFRSTRKHGHSIFPQSINTRSSQPSIFLHPNTKKARKKLNEPHISLTSSSAELIERGTARFAPEIHLPPWETSLKGHHHIQVAQLNLQSPGVSVKCRGVDTSSRAARCRATNMSRKARRRPSPARDPSPPPTPRSSVERSESFYVEKSV